MLVVDAYARNKPDAKRGPTLEKLDAHGRYVKAVMSQRVPRRTLAYVRAGFPPILQVTLIGHWYRVDSATIPPIKFTR